MRLPYTTAEKLAGLFLFLTFGFIAIAVILVGAGQDWFRAYTNYFALYHDGYSLLPGVKVKFLRIDIGRITDVEITPNDRVIVRMTVEREFASRIKGDSQANIKSPTVIGDYYIEIVPGSPESLPIPPGGQIPAEDPKTIDDILLALRLEEKLAQFEQIMANVASLTNQLQDPQGPILGTMDNIKRITGQVAAGEGSLGGLVTGREAYDEIIGMLTQLRQVSDSLNAMAGGLNRDIPQLTAKIDLILNQIEQGTRSLPEVARGAREGLRDVNQVLDSVKKNFLIRGNLTSDEAPDSLTRPARAQ
ncbi:MAG: MlaD family protein [Deltaproteobacteria bacterium]|jgi:phospholipid/cholesterol/gamma-HCH transport system substrate-binding protein|nr:MlaD family protein [Deltaproteobacteria bacterium]